MAAADRARPYRHPDRAIIATQWRYCIQWWPCWNADGGRVLVRSSRYDLRMRVWYSRVLVEPPQATLKSKSKPAGRPEASMTRKPTSTDSMIDQIGRAIAKADGADFEGDPARY